MCWIVLLGGIWKAINMPNRADNEDPRMRARSQTAAAVTATLLIASWMMRLYGWKVGWTFFLM